VSKTEVWCWSPGAKLSCRALTPHAGGSGSSPQQGRNKINQPLLRTWLKKSFWSLWDDSSFYILWVGKNPEGNPSTQSTMASTVAS
jgi:hypothetical protein